MVLDHSLSFYSGYDAGAQSGGLFECRPVELPDYLDTLIHNGKSALEVLEWVKKLPFVP